MVPSWLRRVRWSGTASALAAVVALFGATAVASSLVADREPGTSSSSPAAVAASLASSATGRSTTTSPRVATTSVERRPVPPPTTSTTTALPELPSATRESIVAVDVGPETVTFGTASADPSAACQAVARWSVPRQRADAAVVVRDDGLRLEERDPTSGEVVGVLATWDEAAARPVGDGVSDVPAAAADCGPEDPATDAPTSTVVG